MTALTKGKQPVRLWADHYKAKAEKAERERDEAIAACDCKQINELAGSVGMKFVSWKQQAEKAERERDEAIAALREIDSDERVPPWIRDIARATLTKIKELNETPSKAKIEAAIKQAESDILFHQMVIARVSDILSHQMMIARVEARLMELKAQQEEVKP